ncbi:MAG: N-acetylmuramoyl-L-alanine amidase [Elusimicrobia bacterium]|nr:N-acetylmuramoyl-L-alanine amidase [Elusimicrobiota bacterium]
MLKKLILPILILTSSAYAGISEVKFYKNDQYKSKIKIYVFSEKRYYDSSEIVPKLGGKTYWYSVSGKMIIQLKSHKISVEKKSDIVKYDDEETVEISNCIIIRGGKVFLAEDIFLNPAFSKTMGFRLEFSESDKALKMYEKINISSIRYFSYKDKTRVVIYLYEPLEYSVSRQDGGKFIISLIGGSYPAAGENISIDDGIVKSVSVSQEGKSAKAVFDLGENFSDAQIFTLNNPDRIVADFLVSKEPLKNRIGDLPAITPDIKPAVSDSSTVSAVLPDKISPEKKTKRKIFIDPGHGGKDPGGNRIFGMKEKEINLDIALKLYDMLSKRPEFEAVITRKTDIFIPLNERSEMANKSSADLFISIHANASRNRKESGFEIYFLSEKASDPWSAEVADYENSVVSLEDDSKIYDSAALVLHSLAKNEYINEGSLLASYVAKNFEKKTPFKNRGIKQAAFYVLRGTYAPGILVETGFMTNSADQKNMNDSKIRKKVAEAIYQGVLEYADKKGWTR